MGIDGRFELFMKTDFRLTVEMKMNRAEAGFQFRAKPVAGNGFAVNLRGGCPAGNPDAESDRSGKFRIAFHIDCARLQVISADAQKN